MNIGIAIKAFFKALFNREFAQSVSSLLSNSPHPPLLPEPSKDKTATDKTASEQKIEVPSSQDISPGAVQILSLLQREGRFIDFLQEDLSQASDAQIGAVVRSTIYDGCRKALKQYLTLEPISTESEGESISIEEGFDPANIRLVGQVQGDPPFKGILRHKGWKLTKAQLPEINNEITNGVICPAEVELP